MSFDARNPSEVISKVKNLNPREIADFYTLYLCYHRHKHLATVRHCKGEHNAPLFTFMAKHLSVKLSPSWLLSFYSTEKMLEELTEFFAVRPSLRVVDVKAFTAIDKWLYRFKLRNHQTPYAKAMIEEGPDVASRELITKVLNLVDDGMGYRNAIRYLESNGVFTQAITIELSQLALDILDDVESKGDVDTAKTFKEVYSKVDIHQHSYLNTL